MSNMILYYWMAAANKLNAIKSQKGVTMIEYALIAALVAVFLITALQGLGTSLEGIFDAISAALDTAAAG